MRVSAVVIVPALLAFLFSISVTGTLPPPSLEPLFDASAAGSLAQQLTTVYPSRVPGSLEDEEAARWFSETISTFGFATDQDVWREDLPGLGDVELRNLVTVIPGRSQEAIIVVASRDNRGTNQPFGDNASGTAALIELARGYAPQESAPAPLPNRALVLVSTDAGAYGGAGAERFAASSAYAGDAIAAVVLDGLGGGGRPLLALSGDRPHSPAPALVSTAVARIREETGLTPSLPSVPAQLVDLGLPYAGGEQGRFLARKVASITLTTRERGEPPVPVGDPAGPLAVKRLGQMGRATEALVGAIDTSAGAAFRTPDGIFFRDRVASGWAARLTLLVAIVPFALGALDLLVRSRRRRFPLAPAARALRSRLIFWGYAGILLWIGGLLGVFPRNADLPPPPYDDSVTDWPVGGLLLLGVALVAGWLVSRRQLMPTRSVAAEERLAGYTLALMWLALVAVVLGLAAPYAVLFVLPSLYAWLWLPLRNRFWGRVGLYALGLLGPLGVLVALSAQLGLSAPTAALYLAGLTTTGYLPVLSVLLALAWAASAAQVGALVFGRYAPYASGREPPPVGVVRSSIGRALRGLRRRRRYSRRR